MRKPLHLQAADNIRALSVAMVEQAQSGHPGGPMGGADFIQILYSEYLRFDPEDMNWHMRDRFFLDPGHMSAMLYAQLSFLGKYSMEELSQFRQWQSPTPGHPEVDVSRGVENTSGPLGQGHVMAVGAAIAERFLVARFGEWMSHRTFTFISDGGIQEEISQGAGRLAGYLGLGSLIMFYDSNDVQLSSLTKEVTDEDTAKKYRAWGWHVQTIDGHDAGQIRQAISRAISEKKRPSLIIGKTIMGKGCIGTDGQPLEGSPELHGKPISKAHCSVEKTLQNLGADPANPFAIYSDVADYYKGVLEQKKVEAASRKKQQAVWAKRYPEPAAKLAAFFSGAAPTIDYNAIAQKENAATRDASANVLAHFADTVGNMIVGSADLSDSDKTIAFLKKTTAFGKNDFSGAFLQAGVAEFTMSAVANGMALHGGVIPAIGTFFVFSDYMKPAMRLAALMELPVKYIWTHDAFRVGEDGPTHQPVEQEAQARLLEKLHNHKGRRGMLVLRPADAAETSVAWKMAMDNTHTPTALILSRQNIKSLPGMSGQPRYETALMAQKGAYVAYQTTDAKPDVVLVANGSEVATLVETADLLAKEQGLKVRVVSAISEGLFHDQDAAYKQSVIPGGVPVFGLTAGLPVTLAGMVGPLGTVVGLDHFGYSAPYQVLDEKFGFTGPQVAPKVLAYLKAVK